MSDRLFGAGLIAAALLAASCSPVGPRACTQIGCESGLTVELQGTPDAPFTVSATADDGDTESITCTETEACRLFFQDFTPDRVTITYEAAGRTVQQSFTPQYTRSRPNGEDCPPECMNATVVLDVGP